MMKKLVLLLICLVLTLSISISAFAAGTAKVDSKVSADVLKSGDTVTVTVSLSDCGPFKSMALTPSYDENVFELVSGQWLLTDAMISNFNKPNAAIAYSSEVTKSGNVFQYVLKVKDNATLKDTTIKTNAVIKNGTTSIDVTVSTATIKVICKEHTFGAWNKVNDGNHNRICSACDTVETAAHAWNGGEVTKPATCKETGVKTYTCTVCNATMTESIAKTEDHKFGEYTVTQAATCTEEGVKSRTCSVCGLVDTAKVDPLGHKMGKWTQTKAPTCIAKGAEERKCSVCTHVESKAIPTLAHNYGEPVVVTPATETSVGKQTRTCSSCNEVIEEEIPMIEGTIPTDPNETEPPATSEPAETEPPTTTKPAETEPNVGNGDIKDPAPQNNSWLIWVIIAVAIVAVIVIIIIKRRSY